MSRYEVLTPLSNGDRKPHAVGSIVELDLEEAADLIAAGALRPVSGALAEALASADREPIGTAQRAMAAASAPIGEPNFVTVSAAMREELTGKSHKDLDAVIAAEKVIGIPELGPKPTIAEKIEAIVAGRQTKLLSGFNRAGLLKFAGAAGYADCAALDLTEDAADDAIRAALMRVAAAQVS